MHMWVWLLFCLDEFVFNMICGCVDVPVGGCCMSGCGCVGGRGGLGVDKVIIRWSLL